MNLVSKAPKELATFLDIITDISLGYVSNGILPNTFALVRRFSCGLYNSIIDPFLAV